MNKQLLTIGIVLSFATAACTGFGVQTGPTVAGQFVEEQGLGNLWSETAAEPQEHAMQVELRDDSELADLWIEAEGKSNWNGDTTKEAPRAAATLTKLTPTHPVSATF